MVNTTLQSSSQIFPIPNIVCLNDGITWPFVGKLSGGEGRFNSAVPVDHWTCPVAVPTLNVGAAGLQFQRGASFAKYLLLAPESTTAVDVFANTAAAYVWIGGVLTGKALEFECWTDVSAFSLILLFTLLASPHLHVTLVTQLVGRFAAFAGSSKQSAGR